MTSKVSVWILGDQLTPSHPALGVAEKDVGKRNLRVLMIKGKGHLQRLAYHKKKLVLILSAMRHYAEELKKDGYKVDLIDAENFTDGIQAHIEDHQPQKLYMMNASSFNGQQFQHSVAQQFGIDTEILPNAQFLCNRFNPLPDKKPDDRVRQETFYREMRQHFGILLDADGKPEGGQWNYDQKNRQPMPKGLDVPAVITFEPDSLTQGIMSVIENEYGSTGVVDGFNLAVDRRQALAAAEDFFEHRLCYFGTYEDAMSEEHIVLFHSMLSPYLNLGLLDPLELAHMAEQSYIEGKVELNNAEGFIRQVIGWREYMFWQYQRLMPDLAEENYWGAERPLPDFFWNAKTEMNCLQHVINRVLENGYLHHIERLMLLSNFFTLTGVNPQDVLKWFMCCFIDAYEWVMVPNVIGMGLYADGGKVGTKPYIASANYIHRMGDYCEDCRFNHRERIGQDACPFNFLYWHFLLTHEVVLRENPRMARMLYNLKYLDNAERESVIRASQKFLESL